MELDTIGRRAGSAADELHELLVAAETDADVEFAPGIAWRAVAALREAAGVLAVMVHVDEPSTPAVDPVPPDRIRELDAVELSCARKLAVALGHQPVDDLAFPDTFDNLIDEVRQVCSSRRADREAYNAIVGSWNGFVDRLANAAGHPGRSPLSDHSLTALVDRVRVQREEHGQMLQALRTYLGCTQTATGAEELLMRLKAHTSTARAELNELRKNLRVALGGLPVDTSDEQLGFHARTVHDQLKALRKRQVDVLDRQVKDQHRTRDALVRVAKSLQTYAPGMDDMPDDDLTSTVCGIAERLLTQAGGSGALAAKHARSLSDIAEVLGLGRGADGATILGRIRALDAVEWSGWADQLADVLGVGRDGDGALTPWTDESMALIVERVGELKSASLDGQRAAFLSIADALGVHVPMRGERWDADAVQWLVRQAALVRNTTVEGMHRELAEALERPHERDWRVLLNIVRSRWVRSRTPVTAPPTVQETIVSPTPDRSGVNHGEPA